jgi:hypothetical protein
MNAKYKKSLKIVTLLISALIISTASATIYYTLNVAGTATVTDSPTVQLVAGSDLSGATVTGVSATLAIDALPDVTLIYEEALVVDNTGTGTPLIRLRHVSISNTSATEFEFINIVLLDDGAVQKGYINYTGAAATFTVSVSSSFEQMDSNDDWTIRIETKAVSGATNGQTADISIAVDVQE